MRIVLSLILAAPIIAQAQECDSVCQVYRQHFGLPETNSQPAPSYGLPVQPVLPVPQDRGLWGTGYSIVTNSRPTRNLWDRDVTGSETVQRIVPNDALGQPMRGIDVNNW